MNHRLATFLQLKVSVVSSEGGSFCCNYATDTFYGNYASDNICCIVAVFEVVLSVTGMSVDLSVIIMQVTISVAVLQLEVSAAHIQVTIVIYEGGNCYYNYADRNPCCNYAGSIFCSALCT